MLDLLRLMCLFYVVVRAKVAVEVSNWEIKTEILDEFGSDFKLWGPCS